MEIKGIKNCLIIWDNSSLVTAFSLWPAMEKGLKMITTFAACQLIGNLELASFTSQTNSIWPNVISMLSKESWATTLLFYPCGIWTQVVKFPNRAADVAQWNSAHLITERSWVWFLPGGGLFSPSILSNVSLNGPFKEAQHYCFSHKKWMPSCAAWGKTSIKKVPWQSCQPL